MKKFFAFMLSLAFVVTGLAFVACKPAEIVVKKVSTESLRTTYYQDETIDFDSVVLNVELSNGVKLVLNKGEVDKTWDEVDKDETHFILKTDGLREALAEDNVELNHEYKITCLLNAYAGEYDVLTIVFMDNLASMYDLTKFVEPQALTSFKNVAASTTDESKFMNYDQKYYVGDDNPFKLVPNYNLMLKEDPTQQTSKLHLLVNVHVYKHVGENWTEVEAGTDYTFDANKYAFQFAADAVGNEYRIQMTPKDFTKLFNGSDIAPIELVVTIADGYNVHEAWELGHIAVVGESEKNDVNKCAENTFDRFTNEGGQYVTKKYYEVWNQFYTDRGETNLKSVNGIFLHNDIKITRNDVPADYFASSKESACTEHAVGSLKDWAFVYPHYMPNVNSSFTFNGNYFDMDFSEFPVSLSHNTSTMEYYTEDTSITYLSNSVFFYFAGLPHAQTDAGDTFAPITFKNFSAGGASGKTITGTATQEAAGTPTFLKVEDSVSIGLENSVIREFMMGLNSSQKGDWLVKDTKIYDCYNCGLYVQVATGAIQNSQLKRFGGPVVFAVSINEENGSEVARANAFVVDELSILENYVEYNQTWFAMNGASQLVLMFKGLGGDGLAPTGTTILNADGKMNMQVLVLDNSYLGDDGPGAGKLYTSIDFDNDPLMDYSAVTMEQIASAITAQVGATPILLIDQAGHVAVADPTGIQAWFTLTGDAEHPLSPSATPLEFVGDRLYVYCPIPGSSARAGMIVQLYAVSQA